MDIKLYGLPTCSRCKTAKMMLDKRNIKYEYFDTVERTEELPVLLVDGIMFKAKEALLKIRELK